MVLADGGKTPKAKGSTPAPAESYDPTTFAHAVLGKLGVPATPSMVDFLVSWEAAEGGNWHNSATFNPLGTTLQMPGSTVMGGNPNDPSRGASAGVQRYTSWDQGIAATVSMLQQHNMSGILSAMNTGDPVAARNAVNVSPWGTKGVFALGQGVSYTKASGATSSAAAQGNEATSGIPAGASGNETVTGTPNELAATFGYSTAFFNSDPSLKKLIDSYAGQDATNDQVKARFKADLMDTPWFKKHTNAQREWTQLQTSDPAEAAHQLLALQQTLAQQAKQMGVQIPAGQLSQMARSALSMYGQNVPAGVVQQMLGAQLHYKGSATYSGDVGNDITTLKDLAHSYGVPISDQTMQGWLRNIVSNGADPKSYTDYLQKQAESLYPTLSPQIKQGLTFQQAVDPYRQIAANLTESDPNTIDFTKPKWQKAIMQIDPKSGERTAMSLDQWQTTLKTDPVYGYNNTQQASQQATDLISKLGQMWGVLS